MHVSTSTLWSTAKVYSIILPYVSLLCSYAKSVEETSIENNVFVLENASELPKHFRTFVRETTLFIIFA